MNPYALPVILAVLIYVFHRTAIRLLLKPTVPPDTVLPVVWTKRATCERQVCHLLTLDKLPLDVLVEIFLYLSVRDLCNMERTSKFLFETIRQRHVWLRVVSDIHEVKPLAYRVNLSSMTTDELRAMAVRAFKLHHRLAKTFKPDRVLRMPFETPFHGTSVYSFPQSRFVVVTESAELYLFSVQHGCLDSVPCLYPPEPNTVLRMHIVRPIVLSPTQAYLVHIMNCQDGNEFGLRFRESLVRIYFVDDAKLRLVCQVPAPRLVHCAAVSTKDWGYTWWDKEARRFYAEIFPLSEDSDTPPEGMSLSLPFESRRWKPEPAAFAFVSDRHLMLADAESICVYPIPHPADSESIHILEPFWQHKFNRRLGSFVPPMPRVAVVPPNADDPNHLRFSLYCKGEIRTVTISGPDSGTIRVKDMTFGNHTAYSFGATSVIVPDYRDNIYVCSSFLYGLTLNRFTDRLDCTEDSLVVCGHMPLYTPDDCPSPRTTCLDEDSGLFIVIEISDVHIYRLF